MITPAWTQLRYHPTQSALWRTRSRFVAVPAGRGSGKTEIAKRRVVRYLPVKKEWHDPLYFYALPTYKQAKRVAWRSILSLIPRDWIKNVSIADMVVETVFGSTLYVVGLDQPARIEGVQWDGGVVDESCDQKPRVFELTIVPALTHRNGWCWRIGVPKRFGAGAADFKRFCELGLERKEMPGIGQPVETFTWPSSDILTPEQLAWARSMFDAIDFDEQFGAIWATASGLIFHAFDENQDVSDEAEYQPSLPIIVGSDFNVSPMSWVLAHRIGDTLEVFDEIRLMNTNTRRTLDYLHSKYGHHQAGFSFYGDATGKARKTSAEKSDYLQIVNDQRFSSARAFYPKSNPRVANRFAACNAKFANANGERSIRIHPRCKYLIDDLKNRAYKEGKREPDDGPMQGHMTDAFGYIIIKLWPIRYTTPTIVVPSAGITSYTQVN